MRKIDRKWKFEIAATSAILKYAPIPKGATTWTSDTFGPMREAVAKEVEKLPVYHSLDVLFATPYEYRGKEWESQVELSKLTAWMRTAPTITDFNQAYDKFRAWALRESYWIGN